MFFSLLQKTNLKDYIGNMEIFAGLMASLVHDMNHSNYSAFFLQIGNVIMIRGRQQCLAREKKELRVSVILRNVHYGERTYLFFLLPPEKEA